MNLALVSFTNRGSCLCKELEIALLKSGNQCSGYTLDRMASKHKLNSICQPLSDWTREQFTLRDGLIFIGAMGIAVRSIGPFIIDKITDPAVIVIDEKGQFIIPVLSGHLGGANQLAMEISELIGGLPIITTATDVNQCFAVDLFAKKQGLFIQNMAYAKGISVAILEGRKIGLRSDFPVCGTLAPELDIVNDSELGIYITITKGRDPYNKTLLLFPKIVTLGIGCKRGTTQQIIEKQVTLALKIAQVASESIYQVATIDIKKEESGLVEYCNQNKLTMLLYSSEELLKAKGEFTSSEFVKNVTGVDNICERAAVLGASQGSLILHKFAGNGVTVALAVKEWKVDFDA